jgi:hypothetical protein
MKPRITRITKKEKNSPRITLITLIFLFFIICENLCNLWTNYILKDGVIYDW